MINYGYEGEVLLASPLSLDSSLVGKDLAIELKADWLVCKEVCIPESGSFALRLEANSVVVRHAAEFEAARRSIPAAQEGSFMARPEGAALVAEITGLPSNWQGRQLQAFPENEAVFDHAAPAQTTWSGANLQLRLPISTQRAESPSTMHVVLRPDGEGRDAPTVRVALSLDGSWPEVGSVSVAPAPMQAGAVAATTAAAASTSAWLAIGLAFVGGILLNLMPCVFPVLSLKVVGLTDHAHEHRGLRLSGLAYTLGVVLSFVLLAGLLLGLRAGGAQLGWGFQLQSPEFVAALALLFTIIGLNLLGVFEFRTVLPGNLAGLRAAHPAVDSFLTGVLAVAVASPCTAPFMGVALGAALTLPVWQALAVFASLGLGMSAPYLLITWWPALSHLLPRPGVWMQHFKIAMAFPMLATVVWLLWVLGQQVGIDGVAALLGLLLAVALVAWVFGTPDFGPRSRWVLRGLALVVCGLTAAWALPALQERSGSPVLSSETSVAGWVAWSPQAVLQAQAEGRPVFVDFTAAWCVTCQFNKRGALADESVLADFRARGVVLMRADWTRRDPLISQELSRLGRSGVPVYLLQAPGREPRLLPELLSPAIVREALAGL